MNLERLLLRLIPAVLVAVGVGVTSLTDATHSGFLALAAAGLSLLMVVSLLFYELEIHRSEDRLRERADDGDTQGTAPAITRRGWQPSIEDSLDFDNVSVKGLSLQGAEMMDASFIGASLRNCIWIGAHLQHAAFREAFLDNNNLEGATLKAAAFEGADVRACDFSRAKLESSDWSHASVEDSLFQASNLSRTRFLDTKLTSCTFDKSDGVGADFSGATLTTCTLESADLLEANFSQATLERTDISSLDFSAVILDRTVIDTTSGSHQTLIEKLLALLSGPRPARWIIVETPVAYVQALAWEGGTVRYETVNFDSWPGTKKTKRITDAMRTTLLNIGFEAEEGSNYFKLADFSQDAELRVASERLATALHDVYGVSPDAPLEVTVGGVERDNDPRGDELGPPPSHDSSS